MIDWDLVEMFKTELALCGVKPGVKVAALTEGEVRLDYARATMHATRALGGEAFHFNLPYRGPGRTPLANARPVVEAMKSYDLVMDFIGMLFSFEQNELLESGVRMLMVLEPPHVLEALSPSKDLRRRVEAAGLRLQNAKTLRFTSPHGTDVTYKLTQYPVLTEYGYTDTPGRWDHWGCGFVLTSGDDDGVDGTVVLAPGDIIQAFQQYFTSPVTLKIEKGYVVDIGGEGVDASLMRGYMDSFHDERAYAVSHIGWGLHEKARWHNLATVRNARSPASRGNPELGVHSLSFYGNVLFSLGPNTEVGGDNDTLCHIDMPMRGCSLWLDDELIVERGRIVPDDMSAPGV